ncbi:signal peptidase I [Patescibacteria group bacterium]|nr:signal peptidase I [Patescibacteria group bacterium]
MKKATCNTPSIATAKGNSMHPLIKEGEKLLVEFGPFSRLSVGEIVVFFKKKKLVAHRIIKIKKNKKGDSYILKGDNLPRSKETLPRRSIVGKVTKIIHSDYITDLKKPKFRIINKFFLLYSLLNERLPLLLKIQKLYKIPLFKNLYRKVLQS